MIGDAPQPSGHPVFVANGRGARIVISCDNGRSWTHDQSVTNNDDKPQYQATGIAYGNGLLVAAYGHAAPALVRTSGVHNSSWEFSRDVNALLFAENVRFHREHYGLLNFYHREAA